MTYSLKKQTVLLKLLAVLCAGVLSFYALSSIKKVEAVSGIVTGASAAINSYLGLSTLVYDSLASYPDPLDLISDYLGDYFFKQRRYKQVGLFRR